jgi:hypothetical protein
LDAVLSLFFVKVKDNLRIGASEELMSLAEELFPEFEVVKDLTVEGDPQRGVLVAHRLVTAGQIDDA